MWIRRRPSSLQGAASATGPDGNWENRESELILYRRITQPRYPGHGGNLTNCQFSSEAEAEMRLRAVRIEAVTMRESSEHFAITRSQTEV